MNGRIVAKVPLERLTSFGVNYESYVFEVETGGKHGTKQLVKVSYRFDQRDPRLPARLFDYSLTHTFRMTRDEDCDESWESLSSRTVFDSNGNFQEKRGSLVYASNAPVPEVEPEATLPCYAATPHDYKATVKDRQVAKSAPAKSPSPAAESAATLPAAVATPQQKTVPAKNMGSALASAH